MPVTLTKNGTSTAITLYAKKLDRANKSSTKIIPIPRGDAFGVRLGKTQTVTLTGRIYSTADYNVLDAFDGETQLNASSSDYYGIPNSSKWAVNTCKITQSAGQLLQWDYTLEMTRIYKDLI